MDYKKIYDDLIFKAQSLNRNKKDLAVYESHHILPKSLGGLELVRNKVLLTPKEHFIAHKLLVEIHPGNNKMFYALMMMSYDKRNGRDYRVSAREFERIKNINSKLASEKFSGENNPMYGVSRIGELNPFFGKHHTQESIDKANETRGDTSGENSPLYKIPKTQEHKDNMKLNHADFSGENHPMFGKKQKIESVNQGKETFKKNYKKENHPCFNKPKSKESIEKANKTRVEHYPKGTWPTIGIKKSEEHNRKNSESHKGLQAGEKNGMFGKKGKDNPNTGRKFSEESIENCKKAQRKRFDSEEEKLRIKKMWEDRPVLECPHCHKTGKSPGNMSRSHFDNCKLKPQLIIK